MMTPKLLCRAGSIAHPSGSPRIRDVTRLSRHRFPDETRTMEHGVLSGTAINFFHCLPVGERMFCTLHNYGSAPLASLTPLQSSVLAYLGVWQGPCVLGAASLLESSHPRDPSAPFCRPHPRASRWEPTCASPGDPPPTPPAAGTAPGAGRTIPLDGSLIHGTSYLRIIPMYQDPAMAIPAAEIQERLARFKAAIRRAGVKLTHQRLEIFSEVARTGEHPDAETVYRGVREAPAHRVAGHRLPHPVAAPRPGRAHHPGTAPGAGAVRCEHARPPPFRVHTLWPGPRFLQPGVRRVGGPGRREGAGPRGANARGGSRAVRAMRQEEGDVTHVCKRAPCAARS